MKIEKLTSNDVKFAANKAANFTVQPRTSAFLAKYGNKELGNLLPKATICGSSQYENALYLKAGNIPLLECRTLLSSNKKGFAMYVRSPVVQRVNFCPEIYQDNPRLPQLYFSDFNMKFDMYEGKLNAYFGSFVDLFKDKDGSYEDLFLVKNGVAAPDIPGALLRIWNLFIVPGIKAGNLVECWSPDDLSGLELPRALLNKIQEFMENPDVKIKSRKVQKIKKNVSFSFANFFGEEDDDSEDQTSDSSEDSSEENIPEEGESFSEGLSKLAKTLKVEDDLLP